MAFLRLVFAPSISDLRSQINHPLYRVPGLCLRDAALSFEKHGLGTLNRLCLLESFFSRTLGQSHVGSRSGILD